MIAGPFVFVDVDTQRDFLEPGGALFIPGSEAILPNLARLADFARERGIPVVATACAHTLDEEEPEPFPPHCLVGTRGQGRVEATDCPETRVIGPIRNEYASSRWMPMPVMPPALVSCGAERQLSSGVFARMSWL